MITNYGWEDDDLKRIQFYTSGDIVLQRKVKNSETQIESGEIKVIDGEQIEEIYIPEGTPGVAVQFPDRRRVGVSFEISDAHFLTFGVVPERGNRFYLNATEWRGSVGQVTYNGVSFYTSPDAKDVYLLINMKAVRKSEKDSRTVKGRRVDEFDF